MKHLFSSLFIALIFLPQAITAQTPIVRDGLIDLHDWDFYRQGSVQLNGDWEIYMSELVAPEEIKNNKTLRDYTTFPANWNEFTKATDPGKGFASYHLKIIVSSPKDLAIELPHFYSNYNLWINTKLIAKNGKVGTNENTSEPQWLPQTINFNATTDTLDLVIQVSNFHHAKGGVREPILLGDRQQLNFKRHIAVTSNLILFGTLSLIGLVFIFLYLFSKMERSLLYLAGLCMIWAIRSVFSNEYLANSYFPEIPWELCVKIEYISLYLMQICAILFLASIFKSEVNAVFKYFLCICNCLFIIVALFFKAYLYTQFLPVYLSFTVVLLLYSIYVLIRALVYERSGVWLMISVVFLSIVLFSYDIISYEGFATFNPIIINFGYLAIFVLMAICLLYQLGYLKRAPGQRNMLTYEDLYGTQKESRR